MRIFLVRTKTSTLTVICDIRLIQLAALHCVRLPRLALEGSSIFINPLLPVQRSQWTIISISIHSASNLANGEL